MFTLSIETDNAAFADDPKAEIARILRETADKLETGRYVDKLRDGNGNTVGNVMYEVTP
jgi:hypothetical protein